MSDDTSGRRVERPVRPRAAALNAASLSSSSAISELRRISALTWEQLGQLFRVSRGSVHFWAPLTRRMSKKHGARSEEGRALRALREIRVRAEPAWDASEVALLFLFVREATAGTFAGQTWDKYLSLWLQRVGPGGRFRRIDGMVQALDDLTGRDYVESDPLDLDHLSLDSDFRVG